MGLKFLAKKGWGLLKPKGKPKPTTKPWKPTTKHEKEQAFANLDPFVRGRILSARESAKRGDVINRAGHIVGTPGPHRSAKAIKKYHGPRSYQLTDPARKVRTRKAIGSIVKGIGKIVKHTPWRKELAGLKRTHRTKQKILGARAGRAKQAKQAAGTARLYARHPEAKTMFAKQKFGRQFRKAGIK